MVDVNDVDKCATEMDNQTGSGYSLRQNILTTNHAPESIHRSASRRKTRPLAQTGTVVPQPNFGAPSMPLHGIEALNPFIADASFSQFDDATSVSAADGEQLAGANTVTLYLGHFNAHELQSMCMPASLSPPVSPPGLPIPPSLQQSGLKTPERPKSSEEHQSPSPTLAVSRIPKDRKAIMETCFSEIESLLDKAAQATNRSRANVFSLFANTQTIKRAGRTVWNIYESYYYEDPEREQKRAGIPDADCTSFSLVHIFGAHSDQAKPVGLLSRLHHGGKNYSRHSTKPGVLRSPRPHSRSAPASSNNITSNLTHWSKIIKEMGLRRSSSQSATQSIQMPAFAM